MTSERQYGAEPVPEEDAAEQGRPVTDEPDDDFEPAEAPWDADPADVEDQRRVVPDEDEDEDELG